MSGVGKTDKHPDRPKKPTIIGHVRYTPIFESGTFLKTEQPTDRPIKTHTHRERGDKTLVSTMRAE